MIIEAWDRYMASRPANIRNLYGARPRFENDQNFLPLQAADFWAWWVREWSEAGNVYQKMQDLDFGPWRGTGSYKGTIFHARFSEDQLVQDMMTSTHVTVGPGHIVYDVSFTPPILGEIARQVPPEGA
jgi:hypothetical protein